MKLVQVILILEAIFILLIIASLETRRQKKKKLREDRYNEIAHEFAHDLEDIVSNGIIQYMFASKNQEVYFNAKNIIDSLYNGIGQYLDTDNRRLLTYYINNELSIKQSIDEIISNHEYLVDYENGIYHLKIQ